MVVVLPLVIDGFVNVKLNSVVTSCDSLNIEVNELVLLYLFDVVDVDNNKHVDEDG